MLGSVANMCQTLARYVDVDAVCPMTIPTTAAKSQVYIVAEPG
jgi:hypothetical protein